MKTTVPGQAEGFFLQETRFLVHLLKANLGTVVSLEYLGDVASEASNRVVITEEDKSAIAHNPVSDHSLDLWKTFSNWVDAVKDKYLYPANTIFRLYVPKKCSGNIVQMFSEASTIATAKKALESAQQILWGDAPSFPKKNSVAETLKPYVENIFNSDPDIICSIIVSFEFETGKNASYTDIDAQLKTKMVHPCAVDLMRIHLLGWIKEKIDLLITEKKVASILAEDFYKEASTYLRKIDQRDILTSFAHEITDEEKQSHLRNPKTYIKQLEFIELSISFQN